MSAAPKGHRPYLRRGLVVLGAVVLLAVVAGGPALAAWLMSGTGSSTARASDISTPAAPTTALNASSKVVVSWQGVSLTSGQAATGYVVRRTDSSGTRQVCSVSAPTLSCTDPTAVTTYASYTVSATYASWTSAESPATMYDVAAPSTTLSTSSAANASGWWTTSPVGFTLNATDVGSGVKSITYQVGSATAVTVNAATATFNVSTQGTTVITYRATDNKSNVETQRTFTLKLDSIAPSAPTALAITPDNGASTTDEITNDNKPQIKGSAEAGSTVEVRIDGTLRWTDTVAANGTFTVGDGPGAYAPGTELSNGSHQVSVRAVDAAGNIGSSTALTVVVDRTDPTVSLTGYCNGNTFCGSASDGTGSGIWRVTYEIKRKGHSPAQDACWNGTAFVTGPSACGWDKLFASGTTAWSAPIPAAITPGTVRAASASRGPCRPQLPGDLLLGVDALSPIVPRKGNSPARGSCAGLSKPAVVLNRHRGLV